MRPRSVDQTIDEVLGALSAARETGYIGEAISQLEHALQCAHFAAKAKAPSEEIIAALLHDLGHLVETEGAPTMADLGIENHEGRGADWLAARGFPRAVTELIRNHVAAKRYLVRTKSSYRENLSEASLGTLRHQGGPMNDDEVAAFRAQDNSDGMLRVRRWDEMGKEVDLEVPDLESYRPMMQELLRNA